MTTPAGREPGPEESRAEQVLSQALRAMAGGEKPARADAAAAAACGAPAAHSGRRLSTAQVMLIAAIVGLLIGCVAGLVSLMI